MKNIAMFSLVLTSILSSISIPASAHHSFAMFDQTKSLTIKGKVLKVVWKNPHTYLAMEVRQPNGELVKYVLEGSSPNELVRWGWKLDTVKDGDTITAHIFVLRDGRPGGLLHRITTANGKSYYAQ
jgi:hypothetical protein